MTRQDLGDGAWRRVELQLPKPGKGRRRVDGRRVTAGNFRALRTGAPWRELLERDGPLHNGLQPRQLPVRSPHASRNRP